MYAQNSAYIKSKITWATEEQHHIALLLDLLWFVFGVQLSYLVTQIIIIMAMPVYGMLLYSPTIHSISCATVGRRPLRIQDVINKQDKVSFMDLCRLGL